MAKTTVNQVLQQIKAGQASPIYLITGDLVLAEPKAQQIAQALADQAGCTVETHRHPARLGDLLADLRTYSLFDNAKVMLLFDSAIFANREAAAGLIDQAQEGLPYDESSSDLDAAQRLAASRLLQALHVFGVDGNTQGSAEELLEVLPAWAFQGGEKLRKKRPRGRPAKEVKTLKEGLVALLSAALKQGLQGFAEGDLAELGAMIQNGLPTGHALVMAEPSVAKDHPIVVALAEQKALVDLGKLAAGKGGEWTGLDRLTEELTRETQTPITRDAAAELARRTLRQTSDWKNRSVDAESTARFAGEYRKLASLAHGGQITLEQIKTAVDDRGEEDVWKILDALGNGRGDEAVRRYRRLLAAADNTLAARLSFFSLLASFCRQLVATAGMARLQKVPAGVRSYQQFKSRWAPALQAAVPGGGTNPIAKLHPFRLHRAYLAASGMDRHQLAHLLALVLETELKIKGESAEPDVAIAHLMMQLSSRSSQRR